MVDPVTSRRLTYRAIFLALCAFLIFIKMLPLGTEPSKVPGPDLLFCFAAAWIMRRPNYVPVILVVLIFLLADILFLRPIGLWAALMVLASEFLRTRATGTSEIPMPAEFTLVMGSFVIMVVVNASVYLAFGIPHPVATTSALHILTTAIAYPFVIAITHFILRVRRAKPSDMEGSLI